MPMKMLQLNQHLPAILGLRLRGTKTNPLITGLACGGVGSTGPGRALSSICSAISTSTSAGPPGMPECEVCTDTHTLLYGHTHMLCTDTHTCTGTHMCMDTHTCCVQTLTRVRAHTLCTHTHVYEHTYTVYGHTHIMYRHIRRVRIHTHYRDTHTHCVRAHTCHVQTHTYCVRTHTRRRKPQQGQD